MDQQQQPPPIPPQNPNFQDGVMEIMMSCEELRQPFKSLTDEVVDAHLVANARDDLDLMVGKLGGMHHALQERWTSADDKQVNEDLFQHCQQRVAAIALLVAKKSLSSPEPQPVEDNTTRVSGDVDEDNQKQQAKLQALSEERQLFQGSLARIMELNFILLIETSTNQQEASHKITPLIEQYVAGQRTALRERVKPCIARLVSERKDVDIIERISHSQVITNVLGEASALIHPLLAWLFSLPPPPTTADQTNLLVEFIRQLCLNSISTLNEQAQTLTKTIQGWFWEDRQVDTYWMSKSNQMEHDHHQADANINLSELDGLVEEMAFVCQVLHRYQTLIQDFPLPTTDASSSSDSKLIQNELLPEWTWKYSTLERFLVQQQWKSALQLATPTSIVLGTSIQVPSVVEDAQYLSTRALERAASTRSTQAIGTVAHSISNHVWCIHDNMESSGVHKALVDQIGCYVDPTPAAPAPTTSSSTPKSSSNNFASALLDALDDEHPPAPAPAPAPVAPPRSGPHSGGGLFSTLMGGGDAFQQIRIQTDFCNLNGIHSASTACRSLVKFLDTLLYEEDQEEEEENGEQPTPKKQNNKNPMIELAREELSQYGNEYDNMLQNRIQYVIQQYCGSLQDPPDSSKKALCIPALRYYFSAIEDYALDNSRFRQAESDTRLQHNLMSSLTECAFLQQLKDRCDSYVLNRIRDSLTYVLAELILSCLLQVQQHHHQQDGTAPMPPTPIKQFTDWGSLLLSKQVRMLQLYLAELQDKSNSGNNGNGAAGAGGITSSDNNAANVAAKSWEKLSQIVTVLQLERPSDWILYQSTSILTPHELSIAMQLRIDFKFEAIQAVVSNITPPTTAAVNGATTTANNNNNSALTTYDPGPPSP